jgi:hypothetical protein
MGGALSNPEAYSLEYSIIYYEKAEISQHVCVCVCVLFEGGVYCGQVIA